MFVTKPVTTLTWVTQPANYLASVGFPGTFSARATSDSEFVPTYTWYRNSAAVATGTSAGLSTYTTAAATSADSGATFYVVATTAETGLSITSSVATLNVAAPVLEPGWAKMEYWYSPNPGFGPFQQNLTNASGTTTNYGLITSYASAPNYTIYEAIYEGNSKGSPPQNYTSRLSAYFYPPVTTNYVFYVNSDDPGNLFVSSDANATNAVMVAQELGWSGSWTWTNQGGGGTIAKKCSTTWTAPDGSTPFANGIHMIAGQPYYVALVHRDTGGGNNCEATALPFGAAPPANGTYSTMSKNLIGSYAPRAFNMWFTQQPANASVPFGGLATFTAKGATDAKSAAGDETDPSAQWTNSYVLYQWTLNGALIPGATSSSCSFGPVSPLDNGGQVVCQIRSLGYVNNSLVPIWSNSAPATLTVTGNAVYESGFILHEYWGNNPGRSAVENNAAGNPSWYMASPAFEVDTPSTELADNFTDELVGFFIPPVTTNYVFFMNSDDDADLFVSTNSSSAFRQLVAQETGWAGALNWGTSGGTVSQVRSDTFVTGNPATKPFASGIPLTAGQKYFVQAVHHQGGGGTETCVNDIWVGQPTPANGSLSTMRGARVGAYVPACTYVTPTTQPQSQTVNNYSSVTFTASGATDSLVPVGGEGAGAQWSAWTNWMHNFLFFQWYKNGQPVAGATTSAYTIPSVLPSDAGSTIYCTMRALGYGDTQGNPLWATSASATLNVNTSGPPTLLYSAILTNAANMNSTNVGVQPVRYVDLTFSSRVDPVALLNPLNYSFLPQPACGLTSANIVGITVNSNGYRNVELALNTWPLTPFTVQVNNAIGLGGGPALTGTNGAFVNTVELTSIDIGTNNYAGTLTGTDPALPSSVYASGNGAYTVQCEGNDIWGNRDGFNFLYEVKSGNFDVVVRQVDTTKVSNWTKGGLMLRETLDGWSREWNVVNDPASADGIPALDGSGNGNNTTEANARTTFAGGTAAWRTVTPPAPAFPNAWVRLSLQRSTNGLTVADIVTAYQSTNGVNWLLLGQTDAATNGAAIPLTDPLYVGICTTAHDNDGAGNAPGYYLATADYANYNSSYTQNINLTVANTGTNTVVVSWTPTIGTLMTSPALSGAGVDWQPLSTTNATVVPLTTSSQFFRVKLQ